MDKHERETLAGYMDILSRWVKRGEAEPPNMSQLAAIEAAVATMKELSSPNEDYEQPIAILRYHITHPTALLFRDPVTMRTFKTAIGAMERKLTGRYWP